MTGDPSQAGAAGARDEAMIPAGGSTQVAGAGGSVAGSTEVPSGGAAGAPPEDIGITLPAECAGTIDDYTAIIHGDDAGEMFDEDQLAGRALVLGGSGDDIFFASPPGAGDCLFGGAGSDRFETAYLSAPSVFVGGDGDDVFALRGSTDSDTAYISDFEVSGKDQIHLDAMVYGLIYLEGPPLADEVVVARGFTGGNSTAGAVARILYNPDDGGLWYDSDANGEVATAVKIAVIQNFADYSFDLNDFALD